MSSISVTSLTKIFQKIKSITDLKADKTEIPDVTSVIDDTAGNGVTDKTWSADKSYDSIAAKANKKNVSLTGYFSHGRKSGGTTGSYSFTFGSTLEASGTYSHAIGVGNTANHKSQFVFGEYNTPDSNESAATEKGTYVEIVGNGTSSATSNARTLDWSGNETLSGNITAAGGSLTLGSGNNAVTITAAQLSALLSLASASGVSF